MKFAAWPLALAMGVTGPAVLAEHILLPPSLSYPEGIAFDAASRTAYVVSTRTGGLVSVDLASKSAKVLGVGFAAEIGEAFPGVLGMRRDGNRLVMAGGRTAKIFVTDAATGALTKSITTPGPGPGVINDLAIVGRTAYFTDTVRPILWSVDLSDGLPDTATPWLTFAGTSLQYGPGRNLNGIAPSADRKSLIVGQMDKGLLFAIDIASRKVTPIDIKGELVEGADGLVVKDDLLFVIRQPAAEIVTVRLSPDLRSGTVIKRTKPEGLLWPATAVLDGDALVVVNTQFNRRQTDDAQRPFGLTRVPLSALGGN